MDHLEEAKKNLSYAEPRNSSDAQIQIAIAHTLIVIAEQMIELNKNLTHKPLAGGLESVLGIGLCRPPHKDE